MFGFELKDDLGYKKCAPFPLFFTLYFDTYFMAISQPFVVGMCKNYKISFIKIFKMIFIYQLATQGSHPIFLYNYDIERHF